MSTAVATASASSAFAPSLERHLSPRSFAAVAPANPNSDAATSTPTRAEPATKRARGDNNSNASPRSGENTPSGVERGKVGPPPMIKVKKEPASPSMQSARPRPKRLDLTSSNTHPAGPQTARPSAPLTGRESAGLAIQDVGLACLSPGFATHDPAMREQLQRSLDVRDRQRMIIEARQKGQKPGSSHEASAPAGPQDTTLFGVPTRTPVTSRRKGPPPGLSINAPSAAAFENDRVIQSAPMHQTFTGLRPGEHPFTRHAQHGPSGLSQTSHIHHVPATQTNNRLPPIADVFANDRLDGPRSYAQSPIHSSHPNGPPPVPSPSFPPPHHHAPPLSARAREFRSAEEAMANLSGGREDLMPKVVHYGGVQPPTPPSPMPPGSYNPYPHHPLHHPTAPGAPHPHTTAAATVPPPSYPTHRPDLLTRTSSTTNINTNTNIATARRRDRDEYERDNHNVVNGGDGSSPPSSNAYARGPEPVKRAAFAVRGEEPEHERSHHHHNHWDNSGGGGVGAEESEAGAGEDWRTRMSGAEKREEFLRLCERAWDLFHS